MIDGIPDMGRVWSYVEPSVTDEPIEIRRTELQILKEYWPWWYKKLKELNRLHLATPGNCVEDWVTCHWAHEIKKEL